LEKQKIEPRTDFKAQPQSTKTRKTKKLPRTDFKAQPQNAKFKNPMFSA